MSDPEIVKVPIMGHWMATVSWLPEPENEISIEPARPGRYAAQNHHGRWPKLKPGTKFYAFIMARNILPEVFGQGKTKREALNDALQQLGGHAGPGPAY